jgi:uncharacterized lipoprotein YajG
MEMASILSKNSIADLVTKAISDELMHEGFRVGDSSVVVTADIVQFRNDFKTGFWSGDAVGQVTLGVQVKDAAGNIKYSKTIAADGTEPAIQVMGGDNAKAAMERALPAAVSKLLADQAFTKALLTSGSPAA